MTLDGTIWADAPDRHEAGSPNVVGAVALGAACRALAALGHGRRGRARAGARRPAPRAASPAYRGSSRSRSGPTQADRVGVASFSLDGYRHPLLAAILSAEHAIGVRHGCFCAHPLIAHLLALPEPEMRRYARELGRGGTPELPGAVRASIGLGTTEHDVDRLVGRSAAIARHGPAMRYEHVPEHDEYRPVARNRARQPSSMKSRTSTSAPGRSSVSVP